MDGPAAEISPQAPEAYPKATAEQDRARYAGTLTRMREGLRGHEGEGTWGKMGRGRWGARVLNYHHEDEDPNKTYDITMWMKGRHRVRVARRLQYVDDIPISWEKERFIGDPAKPFGTVEIEYETPSEGSATQMTHVILEPNKLPQLSNELTQSPITGTTRWDIIEEQLKGRNPWGEKPSPERIEEMRTRIESAIQFMQSTPITHQPNFIQTFLKDIFLHRLLKKPEQY